MRNGTGLGARRAWGQSSCVASGRSLYLSKPQFPRNTYLQRGCEDLSSKDSREVGFFNPAQMQVAGGLEGSTCSPPEAIRLGDRGAGLLPRPVQLHSPASPTPTLPLGPPATASEALRPGLVVGEGGQGQGQVVMMKLISLCGALRGGGGQVVPRPHSALPRVAPLQLTFIRVQGYHSV